MDVFDLAAKITLDSSGYESGLSKASSRLSSFGSSLRTGIGTAAKVGAAAVTAATTAVVAMGASSVKAGATFDASMSQVAATMGTTVDSIANLRDFAQEMGRTTAFSASEAADALNYMALAGYDAETSMSMLPNVLNLAAAGGIDLAYASDMVTDAASALGLSIEDTSTMVDQMAKASSKSNTSVSQLGEAILTIGATARNVKGGTTELSTVLGALADNGIKGAEGGTHLRNMILSLQSPTDDAASIMADLGIATYDSEGNMRSLVDIIGDLQVGLDGMDQASKDAVIGGIFNKADLASVNALLNTSQDRFDELTAAIEDSAGAAQEMADTQLDNLNGDITLFKSALEGAQIAISDQLTPSLRGFVQFGSDGLSRLTAAFQSDGLTGAMSEFGSILSDGIAMIVEMLPDAINAGKELLGAVVKGIIDNAPLIIDSAITIVTQLATDIAENADEVVTGAVNLIMTLIDGLVSNAPLMVDAAIQVVTAFGNAIAENAPALLETALNAIYEILTGVVGVSDETASEVINVIQTAVDTIFGIFDAIKTALGTIGDAVGDLNVDWSEVWSTIGAVISTAGQIISTVIITIGNWIATAIGWAKSLAAEAQTEGTFLNSVVTRVGNVFSSIFGLIGAVITVVSQSIKEKIDMVVDVFSWLVDEAQTDGTYLNAIWENIKATITTALDIVTGVIQTFTAVLKGDWDGAFDAIKNTATSTWDGITSIFSNAISGIKGLFNFSWSFPSIKMPHFSWSWQDVGGLLSLPKFSVEWYRKAYDNPIMFTSPTVLDTLAGRKGFGDGPEGEIVLSESKLKELTGGGETTNNYTFNVYAQPGEDVETLARRLEKIMARKERQKAVAYA